MMNDWTDIIGEELKGFEAPLPADDWDVLQRRRAAAARRRKVVAWSWAGAVASVAAVVAVAVLLFRDNAVLPDGGVQPPLLAENSVPVVDTLEVVEDKVLEEWLVAESVDVTEYDDSVADSDVSEPVRNDEEGPADYECSGNPGDILSEDAEMNDGDDESQEEKAGSEEEVPFDVVKDQPDSDMDRLLADNVETASGEADYKDDGLGFEDLPDEKPRRRVKVSLAASGTGLSGGMPLIPKVMAPDMGDVVPPGNDYDDSEPPVDTSVVSQPSMRHGPAMMNSEIAGAARRVLNTDYDHFQPVSFGLSARFALNERFSINTGINYTLYNSRKKVLWSDYTEETLNQSVHYIGIPVRCDWLLVDRKHFGLYLGAGAQVDKAVYAKVGNERMHDRTFLFSINGVCGLQYNINDRFGLYLEPELTGNLNRPEIATFRSNRELMLSVRAGLRVNL